MALKKVSGLSDLGMDGFSKKDIRVKQKKRKKVGLCTYTMDQFESKLYKKNKNSVIGNLVFLFCITS